MRYLSSRLDAPRVARQVRPVRHIVDWRATPKDARDADTNRSSAADHEVHDPPAHVDRALHGLAVEMPADVLVGACDVDHLALAGFGGNLDLAAHLAVHLHRNLDHV